MARDRIRPRVRLVAGLLVLATLAAGALLARRVADRRELRAAASPAVGAALRPPRLAQPSEALPNTLEGLVDHYVAAVDDPTAGPSRATALAAILREPDLERRLFATLAALARDPTAPQADPLWSQATAGLSHIWERGMARQGLDLMIMEKRPRARQALASSFAHLVLSDGAKTLPMAERMALGNDFIDLYAQFPGMQRAEMQRALRAMGNGDAADILQGKGLASDDELEVNRAYRKAAGQSLQASASP